MMNQQRRWDVVVVMSLAASLFCYLALMTGLPGPGPSHVYGAEADQQLGVPDALQGFRGMLVGEIEKKGEREFIIKVVKITRTWKANKADNPQAAEGKKAVCELSPQSRLYEQHRRTLASLKAGDRVVVEPFHLEPDHDHLTVVEELKKVADEGGGQPAKQPPAAAGVPDALRGFKGMLVATVVKKGQDELVIKVEKIDRTWKGNKADHPEAAVGRQAVCELWKEGRLYQKQRDTLARLKPGDRVLVEPFHLEPKHDHLTVVEELRKVD